MTGIFDKLTKDYKNSNSRKMEEKISEPTLTTTMPTNTYTYTKRRREFGRQCVFTDTVLTLCAIDSDPELKKQYARTKTSNVPIQHDQRMAEDEVKTDDAPIRNFGVFHTEGGWPSHIGNQNEKSQHTKTFTDSAQYRNQLKSLCIKMEHKIAQNNTVNLFQEYFQEKSTKGASFDPNIESIACFENPLKETHQYTAIARNASIDPFAKDKMAISYSNIVMGQMNIIKSKMSSFIWDFNRNLQPILELKCGTSLTTLEYNPKDASMIAGGQSNGAISLYDARAGGQPQMQSIEEFSHRQNVSALRWTMSKINVEFFTCANDSYVMWWDVRKLDKPSEMYKLDFDAAGCTAMDYSFSSPTRFLIGTGHGMIINGNKRGKTYADRFPFKMQSFSGPVQSVQRNPCADKYALSVGDQTVRFWSEENHESPIMQTIEYSHDLTYGAWNRGRCSNFFIGHVNGKIDVWDLLYDQFRPIASISMIESRVENICSHPNGKLVISCYGNGDVVLMQVPDFLASHYIWEKANLIEIFERELNREVLFLSKMRELKTQLQIRPGDMTEDDIDDSRVPDVETMKANCISDFDQIMERENPTAKTGNKSSPWTFGKDKKSEEKPKEKTKGKAKEKKEGKPNEKAKEKVGKKPKENSKEKAKVIPKEKSVETPQEKSDRKIEEIPKETSKEEVQVMSKEKGEDSPEEESDRKTEDKPNEKSVETVDEIPKEKCDEEKSKENTESEEKLEETSVKKSDEMPKKKVDEVPEQSSE